MLNELHLLQRYTFTGNAVVPLMSGGKLTDSQPSSNLSLEVIVGTLES